MLGGMKVLLFDFSAKDRDALRGSLLNLGHEVCAETSLAAALAQVHDAEIQVVIGDGRLPKFGWRDLIGRLRGDPSQPYVYFILRSDPKVDGSHEDWAVEAGVDDFLTGVDNERELRRRLRVAGRIVESVLRV